MPSSISNPGGRRLHHFDMLKGIAIAMVVMGHVLTMCIRDIDSAVAFKIISKTHMPVFFFISGYMSGRRMRPSTWHLCPLSPLRLSSRPLLSLPCSSSML
ncbi:MAG: acyltransferase family protein [Muribaculaceae bacterium]